MSLGKFDGVEAANIGKLASVASANIGKVGESEISSPAVFALPTGGTLTVCGGGSPGNSIDGNLGTYWGSSNEYPTAWWQYDYGVGYSKKCTGFRSYGWADISWQNFIVKISSNGTDWTTLDNNPAHTANTWLERTFACTTPGRYVRIENNYAGAGIQFNELQLRME
jgi:hypothetical protein